MFRILALCLLALSIFAMAAPANAGSTSPAAVKAVNAIRAAYGLPALQPHPGLQKAAIHQTMLMARAGKVSHKVRHGEGFSSRMRRVGMHRLAAENLAWGQKSLGKVLKGWLNSPGHRRNMLHPRMRYFGLAAAKSGGRNYWTMVVGG